MYYAEPTNMTPEQREAWRKWQDKLQIMLVVLFVFGIPIIAIAGAYLDIWLHGQ